MAIKIIGLLVVLLSALPAHAQTLNLESLEKLRDAIDEVLESRVVTVTTSEQLHAALKDARAGDDIQVKPGYYDGAFRLPKFTGHRTATLRVQGDLPDRMMEEADVWRLAVLRSTQPGVPALQTDPGAHHWKLDGIGGTQTGGNTYGIFSLGSRTGFASVDEIPSHIEIDRAVVWVDGDMTERRGIQCNAAHVVIRRTSILNIKELGNDSQALGCWDSPGPLLVEDSVLEAAGENFMAGGSDPSIVGMTPTDLTFRRVTFRKRLSWRRDPGGPQKWTVKNIFELKHAYRVRVEDAIFDGIWGGDGQAGYALVITPRNQDGRCPTCFVKDVTFERFIVRNAGSGAVMQATDNEKPSGLLSEVTFRNGLFLLDGNAFSGEGRPFMILGGPEGVTIDHVTAIADGGAIIMFDGKPAARFVYTNNIAKHNAYGFIGTGTAPGQSTIAKFLDKPIILKNVFAGAGIPYPATNLTPSIATFNNQFNADWILKVTSSWKNTGTDGRDLGALHEGVR